MAFSFGLYRHQFALSRGEKHRSAYVIETGRDSSCRGDLGIDHEVIGEPGVAPDLVRSCMHLVDR
jgi:hypothetical protein